MASIHIYAPMCIAAGAIFPPVCTAVVAARFYARRQQRVKIGIDDWLILPAMLLVIGMCAATLNGVARKSVGYPTPPDPPGTDILTTTSNKQSITRSIFWATEVLQVPCLTCIKLSFICFYRRVFAKGTRKAFSITLWVSAVLVVIWGTAYFFVFLFICPGKPSHYWSTLIDEKNDCLDVAVIHDSFGVTDVVLDLIVLVLPMPMIWTLQMNKRQKVGLIGVFALGCFSIVASFIRMITFIQSISIEYLPSTDTDILITGGIYWSVVECGLGVISACLPTVYSLVKRVVAPPKTLTTQNFSHISRTESFPEDSDKELKPMSLPEWHSRPSNTSDAELVPVHATTYATHTAEGRAVSQNSAGSRPEKGIMVKREFDLERS